MRVLESVTAKGRQRAGGGGGGGGGEHPRGRQLSVVKLLPGLAVAGQQYGEATTTTSIVRFSVEETVIATFLTDEKAIAIIRVNSRGRKKLM